MSEQTGEQKQMGTVTFDTTYCVQTQEEIDEILNDVVKIYIYYARKDAEKQKKENGG